MEEKVKYPRLLKIIKETSDAGSSRQLESYLRKEAIVSFISGEKNILDVGCAWGVLSNYLAECGCAVTAIDKNPEYIKHAEELAGRYAVKITFKTCDAEKLDFSDASFDLVIWEEMLEHLGEPLVALKEGVRVLKRNGKFILTVPNMGSLRARIFRLLGRRKELSHPDHKHNFTRDSITALVNEAGFKIVSSTSDFIPIPKMPLKLFLNVRKDLAARYPFLGHHLIIYGRKA